MKNVFIEISGLVDGVEKIVTIKNATTTFEILDRGSMRNVADYGLYSNKGNCSFNDTGIDFRNLIKTFDKTPDIFIKCINNYKETKQLGKYKFKNYTYNPTTKIVELELCDVLLDWQNIKVPNKVVYTNITANNFVTDLFTQLGLTITMSDMTANYLTNIKLFQPITKSSSSLWEVMSNFCVATLCRVVCDYQGLPCILSDTYKGNNVIITPSQILSVDTDNTDLKNPNSKFIISAKTTEKVDGQVTDSVPVQLYELNKRQNATASDFIWVGNSSKNASVAYVEYNITNDNISVTTTLKINQPTADVVDTLIYFKIGVYGDVAWYNQTSGDVSVGNNMDLTTFADAFYTDVLKDLHYEFLPNNEISVSMVIPPTKYFVMNLNIFATSQYIKDGEDEEYSLGDGEEVKLNSNDFVNSKSTIYGRTQALYILGNVRDLYRDNSDFREIEVIPSKYKDKDGTTVYSDGAINMYDIVTPYIVKKGVTVPLSVKDDGSAKLFKVVGIKYSYKGILKQKLVLQEWQEIY